MNTTRIAIALNNIDDDLISAAASEKIVRKKHGWRKCVAAAACLCLVVVGALGGINAYMKQYVVNNRFPVYPAPGFASDTAMVSPEQAECFNKANDIHNELSAQNYEWYGSCYYDFDENKIMIGLTDASKRNMDTVLTHTEDTIIDFYKCDYSYRYLSELYYKLDGKRTVLSLLGVKRYNISIQKNKVEVWIENTDKYAAIYMVSKMDSTGGAIEFITYTSTDRTSSD